MWLVQVKWVDFFKTDVEWHDFVATESYDHAELLARAAKVGNKAVRVIRWPY